MSFIEKGNTGGKTFMDVFTKQTDALSGRNKIFPNYTPMDQITVFAILGGIPQSI